MPEIRLLFSGESYDRLLRIQEAQDVKNIGTVIAKALVLWEWIVKLERSYYIEIIDNDKNIIVGIEVEYLFRNKLSKEERTESKEKEDIIFPISSKMLTRIKKMYEAEMHGDTRKISPVWIWISQNLDFFIPNVHKSRIKQESQERIHVLSRALRAWELILLNAIHSYTINVYTSKQKDYLYDTFIIEELVYFVVTRQGWETRTR